MPHAAKKQRSEEKATPAARAGHAPTTVKLSEDIKARARAAAEDAGQTMHAFMVTAIEKAVEQSTKRRAFIAEARAAEAQLERDGKSIPLSAIKEYLKAKAGGENPPRPKAVKWRK